MSVIDGSDSNQAINISLISNQFDFANQDPGGNNNANQYSWLTSGNHDVQTDGTGMDFTDPTPDTGNVTSIDIDLLNNNFNDPDITIRNITGLNGGGAVSAARLGEIVDSALDFFNEIMSHDDNIIGSDFNDTAKCGAGDDIVSMGDGNDSALGDAGNDSIDGDDGNDTLTGGTGEDTLDGGLGNDVYNVDNVNDVAAEVAGGVDLVNTSVDFGLSTNLENLTQTGSADIDGTGNAKANLITGNSGDNNLSGSSGNDTINGGTGSGSDTVNGGTGADVLDGGLGDDLYIVDNTGDSAAEVASGNDTVQSSVDHGLSTNIENLTLTGAGNIDGAGNSTRANVIIGNSGANLLEGFGLNDTITGGGGSDTLDGGTGNDSMNGQAGNDLYLVNAVGDSTGEDVDTAAGGVDTVNNSATHTLGFGVENMAMTGAGNISGTGNALGNTMIGNNGLNVLSGLGGADFLNGGVASDVLVGGTGQDTLNGFTGADTFDFNTAAESGPGAAQRDVILGFDNPGLMAGDTIDLSTIDANTGMNLNQVFGFLGVIQNPFPAPVAAGSLYLRNQGGDTIVCGNTDGDNALELSIRIADGAVTAAAYDALDFTL